jgi:hypothetical protein
MKRVIMRKVLIIKWIAKIIVTMLLGGISAFVLYMIILMHKFGFMAWFKNLLIYFLISIAVWLIFVVIIRTKIKTAMVATIIIIISAVVYILIQSSLQQKIIKDTMKLWKSKGFPITANEVMPYKATREQCYEWIKKMRQHNPERIFNKEIDDIYAALRNGINVKKIIDREKISTRPEWNNVISRNQAAIEAMKKCPYLQICNLQDYALNPQDAEERMAIRSI